MHLETLFDIPINRYLLHSEKKVQKNLSEKVEQLVGEYFEI